MSKKPSLRQRCEAQTPQGLSTSARLPASDVWQAWFDGAALPNPGKIGIGAVLIAPDGERHEHSIKTTLNGCSNEAELHAVIAAMELALAANCRRLRLHGDSQVAIRHVAGEETTEIPRLIALITKAQQLVAQFNVLQLKWIPRHRNAIADRLSREALGLGAKPL